MANLANFAKFGRKIIGIGANYRQIIVDLGFTFPEKPIIYFKLPSSYISKNEKIKFPPGCTELWYEVELGVVIGKAGKDIPENQSMGHVGGYTCALDMTSWTHVKDAMDNKQSWCLGKGFDSACPVGDFINKQKIPDPQNLNIWLKLNGEIKQNQHTSDMIFTVPKLVSYISAYITLEPGDLIVTGTPAGYGCVQAGDVIEAGIKDNAGSPLTEIEYTVDYVTH